MDGASKWRQIWNITMPGLLPTIVLMLILKVGYILETGFEQVLVFYNPAVYEVADIIQTYVYRLGMGQMVSLCPPLWDCSTPWWRLF